MGDLKVKYFPTGKVLDDQFTKPLQGTDFQKFRSEIQKIPENTPDTDLVWDRTKNMFIPIPHECVDLSDVNTDNRTNKLWEVSTV